MELKNICIIGPRGNVGSAIITELLNEPSRFKITTLSRPTSSYVPPQGTLITSLNADFDSLSYLTAALQSQDAVLCCLPGGTTQFLPQKLIIDAAVAAGVKLFFADEFVGDIMSPIYERMPTSFVGDKRGVRGYLEGLAKEGKIGWMALNGGPFFDMWLMKGPAGFDVRNRQCRIYGAGDVPLHWTPLSTIALAVGNMLRNPDPVLNRAIHICGVENLTQLTLLSALESMLGEKFKVENVDIEEIDRNSKIILERGNGVRAMKGLSIAAQFSEEARRERGRKEGFDNEVVGVKALSVEEAIQEAFERWGVDCPVVEGMFRVEAPEVYEDVRDPGQA